MRSNPPCCREVRKADSVSTRVTSQAIPSISSVSRTNAASATSSSRCRRCNRKLIAGSALPDASGRRLVDDRPKTPEFLDRVDKFVEIDWLHDIGVDAQLVAGHHVLFFAR